MIDQPFIDIFINVYATATFCEGILHLHVFKILGKKETATTKQHNLQLESS